MTDKQDRAEVEITKASGDVFADLGLSPGAVAERFQKEIDRLQAQLADAREALNIAVSRGCSHCANSIRAARKVAGSLARIGAGGEGKPNVLTAFIDGADAFDEKHLKSTETAEAVLKREGILDASGNVTEHYASAKDQQ